MLNIKCKLAPGAKLPHYATDGAAGMDLIANEEKTIYFGEAEMVKTGLFLEIPQGYEAQIRPRSGLALKNGITVLNAPGTIDSDYRGEIGVILINLNRYGREYLIHPGDRIAQLVFAPAIRADLEEADLSDTDRGEGGFGSTGVK